MPQTLIHDGHPDILDAIVGYTANLQTLVALHGTCRAMRGAVEPVLLGHVELHSRPTAASNGDVEPTSSSALVMAVPSSNSRIDVGSNFPALPFHPAAVKVLDLVTPQELSLAQANAFTSLHILRSDHGFNDLGTFEPHTVVRTVWADHGEQLLFGPGVRRLVLHVCFPEPSAYEWGTAYHAAIPLVLEHHAEEVVLACSFPHDSRFDQSITYHQFAYWLLKTLQSCACQDARITIVGLEELEARYDDEPTMEEWLWDNYPQLSVGLDNHTDSDEPFAALRFVMRLLPKLRFMTFAEWHAELGKRKETEGWRLEPGRGIRRPPYRGRKTYHTHREPRPQQHTEDAHEGYVPNAPLDSSLRPAGMVGWRARLHRATCGVYRGRRGYRLKVWLGLL